MPTCTRNQAKRQRTASVAKRIPMALLTNILEMKHEMEVVEWREEHKRRFATNYIDIKAGLEREAEPEQVLRRYFATFNRLEAEMVAMDTRVTAKQKELCNQLQHHLAVRNQLHAERNRLYGIWKQLYAVRRRWRCEKTIVSRVAALQ